MRLIALPVSSVLAVLVFFAPGAWGQSKNLAPGFSSLPRGPSVVIMPTDIKLFSVAAGYVLEPKADWTEAAAKYFKAALLQKNRALGLTTIELADKDAGELAEINALHGAVARSIALHHFGTLPLPTKEGKLDWSFGEPVQLIKKKTGADYALFSWVRDSYTSGGQAAIIALGILTRGPSGPPSEQVGYASLVDLNTGRVLWFNRLQRTSGDLREADRAAETLDALLQEFPVAK